MIHLWRVAVCCLGGAAPVHLQLSLSAIKQCCQCNPPEALKQQHGQGLVTRQVVTLPCGCRVGWRGHGSNRTFPDGSCTQCQPRPPSGGTLWQRHSQMVLTWSPLPIQSILFGFSYSLAVFHCPFPGAFLRS